LALFEKTCDKKERVTRLYLRLDSIGPLAEADTDTFWGAMEWDMFIGGQISRGLVPIENLYGGSIKDS
jgi:hypothetical protein